MASGFSLSVQQVVLKIEVRSLWWKEVFRHLNLGWTLSDPPFLFDEWSKWSPISAVLNTFAYCVTLVLNNHAHGFHSFLIFACLSTLFGTIIRLKYFIDVFHLYGTNTALKNPADFYFTEYILVMCRDDALLRCLSISVLVSQQFSVTRLGRWIDFENDYKTLYPEFMESVW